MATRRKQASPAVPVRTKSAGASVSKKARVSRQTAATASPKLEPVLRRIEEVTARLAELGDRLVRSLSEVPKATDFQPLADHLYEFVARAPQLVEALKDIPRATSLAQESSRALGEISETLQFTHERFSESLLHLPRAEDYEPLANPLREFARVAPSLAEALAEVVRATRPLSETVRGLQELAVSLRAVPAATPPARPAAPATDRSTEHRLTDMANGLRQAAACLTAGRDAIADALATLPRDPAYAPIARQLRELATVSPSLLAWLEDVPKVAIPLTGSVETLASAARNLDAGLQAALLCLAHAEGEASGSKGRR